MTEAMARTLARLITQLRHSSATSDLIAGRPGVFHLLVKSRSEASEALNQLGSGLCRTEASERGA